MISFLLLVGILISTSTSASSFGSASFLPSLKTPQSSGRVVAPVLFRGGSSTPPKPTSTDLELADSSSSEDVGEETEVVLSVSTTSTSTSTCKMGPNSSPPGLLRSTFPSLPWHKLPNYLCYARLIAIPALTMQFYLSSPSPSKNIITSLIFSVASLTDFLDGYLARRWDITSAFGAFIDPVADKLMVSTTLVLLAGKYGLIVALPAAIILAREIAVSALREWMASRGKRDSVKVGFQGKVKTAATMVALTIVSAVPDGCIVPGAIASSSSKIWEITAYVGIGLLYLSALVTITSGSVYFKAAAPVLLGKED